jgi:hypothetical protein
VARSKVDFIESCEKKSAELLDKNKQGFEGGYNYVEPVKVF